jgi:hypothetical protein
MTDDDIRALVKTAIARHLGSPPSSPGMEGAIQPSAARPVPIAFRRYVLQRPSDDGMCLIEAGVKCNHCGYCECHGH